MPTDGCRFQMRLRRSVRCPHLTRRDTIPPPAPSGDLETLGQSLLGHHPPMALDLDDAKARKPGLTDRLGFTPAESLRTLPAALAVGFVAAFFAGRAATAHGLGPALGGLVVVLSAAAGFVTGLLAVRAIAMGAAAGVAGAVMPSGASTPSRADYSREDALLMQRDIAGALESLEARIAADPALADARLRAADIYGREGQDPLRAEVLFREVQRIPGVSLRDDVYASNRLVDLYDGPLGNTGRALVELRRLIERYPGTRAADEARRGLTALKARHAQADEGPLA